ncbi:MAG: ROK family protein [Gemmatimonadota bacterium]|nr:ROK family protein [Gemmatimonadota bacterium]MDE2865364.1 ROK family protein [Gemmatimonadota bacterium]
MGYKDPSRPAAAPEQGLMTEVLDLLWRRREVSRAEVARHTGRSRSTISDAVARLLNTGLVEEVGSGQSRGGRRPILIGFRDDAGVILGVDLGATHVSVILTDLRGSVLAWRDRGYPVRTDPGGAGKLVVELCRNCLAEWNGDGGLLMGIGVAVPSPVDPESPDRVLERIHPAWRGRAILDRLDAAFGAPVFVDNDANLGAVAERWWGKALGVDDFLYLKVATGVGAGLMIGGEIYRGSTGVAGEIGHIVVDPRGPECVCGSHGCLATFVGTQALIERTRVLLRTSPPSALANRDLDIKIIEDAALSEDPVALRVVHEAAHHLGIALAGVLNLLNPGSVVIGGSLARAGDRLLVPLREAVLRRTLVTSAAAAEIVVSELGPHATALGAATHVLVAALANPALFPGVTSA